jgi:hypothetical protein
LVERSAEANGPGGDSVLAVRRATSSRLAASDALGDTIATSGVAGAEASTAAGGTAGTGAFVARQHGASGAIGADAVPCADACAAGPSCDDSPAVVQQADSSQQHAGDSLAAAATGGAETAQSATGAQGAKASAARRIVARSRMNQG